MKKLNSRFRRVNKPTDVLSFPLKTKIKNNIYLGDVAISFEIVNKRSKYSFFIKVIKLQQVNLKTL